MHLELLCAFLKFVQSLFKVCFTVYKETEEMEQKQQQTTEDGNNNYNSSLKSLQRLYR